MLLFIFGVDKDVIDKYQYKYLSRTLFIRHINVVGAMVSLDGTTTNS
jgi:hypothetical protein